MENEKLHKIRHSLAHLLAMEVLKYDPKAKLAIGPVIENGFYYDFDFSEGKIPSEKDLKNFQKGMKKLASSSLDFTFEKIDEKTARELFKDEPYKLELIDELVEKGEELSIYKSDDFTDLCAGPHIENTKEIPVDGFMLEKTAGAYWRGNEKNKMLTRIYGVAFESAEELENYKKMREEALKRDHRKLGKELDLFTFSDKVGSGLPMYTPKGTVIIKELYRALLDISKKYGVQEVQIPHMAKRELYETSGHAEKFGDELFKVIGKEEEFVLKPVNCPHHTQIYASRPRSYRDLPVRFMESTQQHRDEKSGEIGGLTRTRSFQVDDGHTFCTVDQVKDEALRIAKIIQSFYEKFDLWGKHWVSLSVRDPKAPEKYIGDEEGWEKSEAMLQELSDEMGLDAKRMEGEAAIYGPKLDFMFKDALGNDRQLATIQIDFAMPKRFELEYTDKDGEAKTPVMIHRAILGSYERFISILIEHYGGAFPFWISPVQAKIVPVAKAHLEYAENVAQDLREAGVRIELDSSDDSLGKKIRNAKKEKVPYIFVIGDKEMRSKSVNVENRDSGKSKKYKLKKVIKLLTEGKDL